MSIVKNFQTQYGRKISYYQRQKLLLYCRNIYYNLRNITNGKALRVKFKDDENKVLASLNQLGKKKLIPYKKKIQIKKD